MTESKGDPVLGMRLRGATWSPDGTQIAYVGPGAGVIRPIMVIPASGGTPRRVTTNGLGPSWGG